MAMVSGSSGFNNENTVIYCRVSSKNQNTLNSTSLESQEDTCKEYCKANGLNITDIIHDVKSASKNSGVKTQIYSYIQNYKKKPYNEHIVVYAGDRFSRNTGIGSQLIDLAKKKDLTIHFVRDGFKSNIDTQVIYMKQAIITAEAEALNLSKRIKASIQKRRQRGELIGRPEYGFRKKKVNNKSIKVTDFYEQGMIKLIKMLFAEKFKPCDFYSCLKNFVSDEIYNNFKIYYTDDEGNGDVIDPNCDFEYDGFTKPIDVARIFNNNNVIYKQYKEPKKHNTWTSARIKRILAIYNNDDIENMLDVIVID